MIKKTAARSALRAEWSWNEDIWPWVPERGRWQPCHRHPDTCFSLSYAVDGGAGAYDDWCENVFYGWEPDPPNHKQKNSFRAYAAGMLNARGDAFLFGSDAISGTRRARGHGDDDIGRLMFYLILDGRRHYEQEHDVAVTSGPGEWTVYDPNHSSYSTWDEGHHRGVRLALDRELACRALGGRVPPPSRLLAAMRQSRLSRFLDNQLRLLAQHGGALDEHERSVVLNQTLDLALATLESCATLIADSDFAPAESHDSALFLAARQAISRHLHDPAFNAAYLARLLGCSRSVLYRAFSAHGVGVAGYLRERRLERAYHLLQSAPPHVTIADIAARCGFLDSAGFSRLFRHRFDIKPSELRPCERRSRKR